MMDRRFIFSLIAGLGLSSPAFSQPILVGNATSSGGTITLTNGSTGETSAAWFASPLSTSHSFTATFNFSLRQATTNPQADGIGFALQNTGTSALGSGGGGVGYSNMGAVGSIIRTYTNNQAGLDTTGSAANAASISSDTSGALTNLGNLATITGTQTVSYNATTNTLKLNELINGYSFSQSVSVNLAQKFGSTMYAGFTGASGGNTAIQTVSNYSLAVVPDPATLYLMMAGGLGLIVVTGSLRTRRKRS